VGVFPPLPPLIGACAECRRLDGVHNPDEDGHHNYHGQAAQYEGHHDTHPCVIEDFSLPPAAAAQKSVPSGRRA
jgi:hypothetical protein